MESAKQRRTLSRTSSYLDALATALRDLGGPTTIPHELTQNADDAGNATRVRFSVDDDALTVWNDGTFTDCNEDGDACLWTQRCDLHAFRRFAGRTKAADASTTGAFGVGFTAVYQITDRPELLYADQHWLIDETASENERLRACDGSCRYGHNEPGTMFVLPWAREDSALRAALSVSPVTEETVAEIEDALLAAAKPTILFLQHVSQIEVITRTCNYRVEASRTASGAVVQDDVSSTDWLFLTADFRSQANVLAAASHGLIDTQRSSAVKVAFPIGAEVTSGVLYATLPTQTPSGLPGHINATFYPTTDRKSVRFESDIYSEWNRAAIAALASALAEGALDLVGRIGIPAFWELLGVIEHLSRNAASSGPNHAQTFLDELRPLVPNLPVIETIDGTVVKPSQAYLPMSVDAYAAADALNSIGLPVISKTLHRRLHTNSVYVLFGIQPLTSSHVVRHLMAAGLTYAFEPSSDTLTMEQLKQLLALMSRLQGSMSNIDGIRGVAIVPCTNGLIAPASKVVWPASGDDAALFDLLVPGLFIADTVVVSELCPELRGLPKQLDVSQATALLEDVDTEKLAGLADDLLAWFDRHLLEIDSSKAAGIAALPIFRTSSATFRPLTSLSLPQDFDDPINVASLVDVETARDYHRLLDRLGARPLNVVSYFLVHVLPAASERRLNGTQASHLLRLAARYQLELEPHKQEFANAYLIPGVDGKLRAAYELHMPTDEIAVLAPELPIADTVSAPATVLAWLGVARIPTDEALQSAVVRLDGGALDPEARIATAILHVLQQRAGEATKSAEPEAPPAFLTSHSWLPLRAGGTGKPADVLPTNARHLYGEQGKELGLASPVQLRYFPQLTWLGMPASPPVQLVVEHLKHCAETNTELNPDVYRVLSNNAGDSAVRQLRNIRSIHVGHGMFVLPSTAFWGRTPFGRWSTELPGTMRDHQKFFDAVGVQEEPGPAEVSAVVKTIIDEFGNDLLSDEAQKALHGCWTRLSELLDHPEAARILAKLGHTRSALDPRGVLASPDGLFFEDSRGTCRRFKLLTNNVIPRLQATWPALEHAGVRRVEELISAAPVGDAPQPDDKLPHLILERIGAFRRLLDDEDSIRAMQHVKIFRAQGLSVKFRAELYGHSEEIGPELTDAIYLRDEDRLIYDENSTPRALARELARAIYPDDDPGRLAIQLQPVLDAKNAEDAHATLDDYGIDKLNTEEHEAAWSVTAKLGGESPAPMGEVVSEAPNAQPLITSAPNGGDPQTAELHTVTSGGRIPPPGSGSVHATQSNGLSGASGRRNESGPAPAADVTGSAASSGTLAAYNQIAGPGSFSTNGRSAGSRSSTGRQTRLRSYVLSADSEDSLLGTIGNEAPDWTPIDQAGVSRILAYEARCGRRPVEKEHGNPGFDIESYDKHDNLVRRIEIKSTGRAWSTAGVMMSRRQFQQAGEDKSLFWLYVVENAEDDENFHIYRIQDPAGRIDYFGFDDGWKAICEPDIDRDEAGAPALQSTRSIFGLL